jgi:hypothetical protein
MKKYIIRINCISFQDIEVEAENKEEAIEKAMREFNCPGNGGEFGEILSTEKIT